MCDCGCNTCETKSTLMLNESLAPRDILSEGLKHHMDANKPLTEHLYRAGSDSYFNSWAEARSLYSRNILEITHEDDLAILTETDLGHFGMFEGKKVPLDFPIELNEVTRYSGFNRNPEDPDSEPFEPTGSVAEFREDLRALFGKFKGDLKNPEFIKGVAQIMVNWKSLLRSQLDEATRKDLGIGSSISKRRAKAELKNPGNDGSKVYGLDKDGKRVHIKSINDVDKFKKFELDADLNEELSKEDRLKIAYSAFVKAEMNGDIRGQELALATMDLIKDMNENLPPEELLRLDLVSHRLFDKDYKQLDGKEKDKAEKEAKMHNLIKEVIEEAKKNTKKLNKPMRDSSGGKAYKVYVKDPKTKKIKTVRFGSGGLKAKINNKEARNAFAARHKCSTKKDKTKAGYWSCRLPRYAKLLGLKSNFGGFW